MNSKKIIDLQWIFEMVTLHLSQKKNVKMASKLKLRNKALLNEV